MATRKAKGNQKLTSKDLITAIETVGGVSKANATSIFNLFASSWEIGQLQLLTVLNDGEVSVNNVVTKKTTMIKTKKKTKGSSVVGKIKTKGKTKRVKKKLKVKVTPKNNDSTSMNATA